MTSEAALRGIPAVSYDAVLNLGEKYLVRKGLVIRCREYKKIPQVIESILKKSKKSILKEIENICGQNGRPF